MAEVDARGPMDPRQALVAQIAADMRAMTAASEHIGRAFAALHQLHSTDFRALQHIVVAEAEGRPLMASELAGLLGISSAALTYLTERLTSSGHVRRESDRADRRKTLLRFNESALEVAREFFGPLGDRVSQALEQFSDEELQTTHAVFGVLIEALRTHSQHLDEERRTGPSD